MVEERRRRAAGRRPRCGSAPPFSVMNSRSSPACVIDVGPLSPVVRVSSAIAGAGAANGVSVDQCGPAGEPPKRRTPSLGPPAAPERVEHRVPVALVEVVERRPCPRRRRTARSARVKRRRVAHELEMRTSSSQPWYDGKRRAGVVLLGADDEERIGVREAGGAAVAIADVAGRAGAARVELAVDEDAHRPPRRGASRRRDARRRRRRWWCRRSCCRCRRRRRRRRGARRCRTARCRSRRSRRRRTRRGRR